jgi:hypothetical protein
LNILPALPWAKRSGGIEKKGVEETVSYLEKRTVIPAKAGIQFLILFKYFKSWMPPLASVTNYDTVTRGEEASLLTPNEEQNHLTASQGVEYDELEH